MLNAIAALRRDGVLPNLEHHQFYCIHGSLEVRADAT